MIPGSPKLRLPICFNVSLANAEQWNSKCLDDFTSSSPVQLCQLVSYNIFSLPGASVTCLRKHFEEQSFRKLQKI